MAVELVLAIVFVILWLVIGGVLSTFPVGLFTIAVGGLYLTVAGCIGPGRYQREYDILLYTPDSGSSFSSDFTVSGFVMDPSIREADVMINSQKVATITFGDDDMGRVTVSRKDFINSTLNEVYLRSGERESNKNMFTLFEYTEDMTDEEIDEFAEMESRAPEKTLSEAKQSYTERLSSRIGSIVVGVSTVGILNLVSGFLLDYFYGITF